MKYLFWAYTATWLVLFGYTISLGWRQNKLAKDLNWLRKMMDEKHRS